MNYILTHSSGSNYKINTTLSIEEYKSLLTKGEEVLAIYDLEDNYVGIEDAVFLDKCEISIG